MAQTPSPGRRPGRPRVGADTSRLTPGCTHGRIATYSKGCRCDACREAWRAYRGPKVAEKRRREREATHPAGCMCRGCRRDRGEL